MTQKIQFDTARFCRSNAGRMGLWQGKDVAGLIGDEVAKLKRRNGILAGRAAGLEEQISDMTTLWDDDVEARYIKEAELMNCPCCGGSGHIEDCDEPAQKLKAELAALKEAAKTLIFDVENHMYCESVDDSKDALARLCGEE